MTRGDDSPYFLWGVKSSLRSYISGAAGELQVSRGAELVDGEIRFAASEERAGAYRGTVRLLAHGGLLDWKFSDPEFDAESHELTVVNSAGQRFALALVADANHPKLTGEGSVFFDGMYPSGSELDPMVFG